MTNKQTVPICIPSWKRYSNNKSLELLLKISRTKDVYVFVREEELESYKTSYPEFNYVALRDVAGLADTRQAIHDFCFDRGCNYYVDMDDDITSIGYKTEENV